MGMAAAYLIVNYDVDDPEGYASYQEGAAPALKIGDEAEIVVFDIASEVIEGDGAGHQTVVLKFDSKEKAREIYESEAYQSVLPVRLGSTSKHFALLVDGFG